MSRPPVYRARPRRRSVARHVRTAATLLVLLGFVAGAAWYGWRALTGPEPQDVTVTEPCRPAPAQTVPAPGDVEVNVFNATQRPGLAGRTADLLRGRGFAVLDVANDPLRKTIRGTAEVRANPGQEAAAALVLAQVPEATFVPDNRSDTSVDLVLGEAFDKLTPPDRATPPAPTSSPSPEASGTGTPLPAC